MRWSRKPYRSINDYPECEVCKVIHKDVIPYDPAMGCLCCQEQHEPLCECGEPGYVDSDPYSADVNNDSTPTVICSNCYSLRAEEI